MKHNDHLTIQCIIDYCGMHSDAGIPGAINVVTGVVTDWFSSHKCPQEYISAGIGAWHPLFHKFLAILLFSSFLVLWSLIKLKIPFYLYVDVYIYWWESYSHILKFQRLCGLCMWEAVKVKSSCHHSKLVILG